METLQINTQPCYPIHIGLFDELLNDFIKQCKKLNPNRIAFISDDNTKAIANKVQSHIENDFTCIHLHIKPGEASKTREQKTQIENALFECGATRDTLIVAVGGGVVTDFAGFVAATFCRGIPVIYFPTTLLSMIDASIGGKTGVNTRFGKNLIGAFKQPNAVYMSLETLDTLPDGEYQSGVIEAIKHALIIKTPLLALLQNQADHFFKRDHDFLKTLLLESAKVKANIVEQDTQEKGLREILNFGHTVAHAFERASNNNISHGEAVALGIRAEAQLAHNLNYLPEQDLQAINKLLDLYQQPKAVDSYHADDLITAMQFDKKNRQGEIHVVLLKNLGEVWHKDNRYSQAVDAKTVKKIL